MHHQMHMNASNGRRNSRVHLLQQQQQHLKQQQIIYPSIPSNVTHNKFNLHMPSGQTEVNALSKDLRGDNFTKQTTPILYLTTNQGLQLRTLNASNQVAGNENTEQDKAEFNVRSCDLERWNSKLAPLKHTKDGLRREFLQATSSNQSTELTNKNAQNLFEMQGINFARKNHHHYHHTNNQINHNNNNYNNEVQKKSCVVL